MKDRAGALRDSIPVATVAAWALSAIACGSSTATSVTSPSTSARCDVTVSSSISSFGPAGGVGTVSVGVARECPWHAASQAGWIVTTSAADGQGDGTFTFRVAENSDPVARQGAIAVADRQVSIAQGAAPCRFDVIPTATEIGAGGGELMVNVHAHAACPWTARSDVAWAAVSPGAGQGNAIVRIAVSRNAGAARPVTVVVAGQPINAMQGAADTPAPPSPTPSPGPAPTPSPTPSPTPAPAPLPPPPTPGPIPIGPITLSGKIGDVTGVCPAISFELGQRVVYTTAETEFRKISCSKIDRGTDLEVEGMEMSDGRVRADRVTKR